MTSALVLSRHFPFNPTRVHAVYQRLGAQIQALARVVDRVDCIFLVPPSQARSESALLEHEAQLRALWSPALRLSLAIVVEEKETGSSWAHFGRGLFDFRAHPIARSTSNSAAVAAVKAALGRRPDLVLAHRLSTMCLLLGSATTLQDTPVFFDMDDVEHVAWFRRLVRDPAWNAERLYLLQTPSLLLAELRAMRLAEVTFVCSEADKRYLARFPGARHVEAIPNSVRFPQLTPDDTTEALVLFVGSMGSRPNAQAVDILVQSVWPLVKKVSPNARLAIIGNGAEMTSSFPARDPTVSFLGFVEDLAVWYQRARVVCCPIYHGSGTRVKIIEAAAHAKAIVTTRLGAEGLSFVDGPEILLRDSFIEIASAVSTLLQNSEAARKLGRCARERASGLYERTAVVERLAQVFRTFGTPGLRASTTERS